jgi:hypothetical protein
MSRQKVQYGSSSDYSEGLMGVSQQTKIPSKYDSMNERLFLLLGNSTIDRSAE